MEYGVIIEKLIVTQLVKKSLPFIEPEGSLRCSKETVTGPYPEPDASNPHFSTLIPQFRDPVYHLVTSCFFYCEELSAPRPTLKLEDHLLSAVRYSPYLEAVSSSCNSRIHHVVVTGTKITWSDLHLPR